VDPAPLGRIELGEDWSLPVPARRRPRARRRWWVLAVAVACLSLTASVPLRPGLVTVLRVPYGFADSFAIAPGTLLVLDGRTVTGYALPSGARRWRTEVPATIKALAYLNGAGIVVANGAQEFITAGLDYRTGRILWQRDNAYLADLLPARNLAVIVAPASGLADQMSALDLRTGRTVWQRELPPGTGRIPSWPDGSHPYYAVQEADGTVDVIDDTTGATVARVPLPPPDPTSAPTVSLVGRQLLAAVPDGTTWDLTAYDIPTRAVRWRTGLSSASDVAQPCGRLLCLLGSGIIALDPGSGAVMWRTADWQSVDQLPDGLLMFSSFQSGQYRAVMLARPTTLRPILDLTGWFPVTDPTVAPLLLARDGPNLGTWFAIVDLSAPAVRPLDLVPGVVRPACWAALDYLACPTVHKDLQVWRYDHG
jgi:outer membrane protein assembly factor BamB